MYFQLLGPLEVRDREGEVPIGEGKRRALLAILLMRANRVVSIDRLVDEVWEDDPPASADKAVRVYVSQLRKELHDGCGATIVTHPHGYLIRTAELERDIDRFERALADGERALTEGRQEDAADVLREGLRLWHGPALADFADERFAQPEIARLEELHGLAVEKRIEADLALGRHADVVGELEALVAEEPLREERRALLMTALYRCGRQAEALDVYRQGRRVLVDSLGIEPGQRIRELEHAILAQTAPLGPVSPATQPGSASPTAKPTVPVRAVEAPAASQLRHPWLDARSRIALTIMVGAAMLLGAALLAGLDEIRSGTSRGGTPAMDVAGDSVLALAAGSQTHEHIPLGGRITALAADRGMLWASTVDSDGLAGIGLRANAVSRLIPLPGAPSAIAARDGTVWVADVRPSALSRVDTRSGVVRRVAALERQPPVSNGDPLGEARLSIAVADRFVWAADGSARLVRVRRSDRAVSRIAIGHPIDAIALAGRSLWAVSARGAAVLRIDAATGAVTARVGMDARPEAAGPFGADIAASGNAVWVLNRNTGGVVRIDGRTGHIAARAAVAADRGPSRIAASATAGWVASHDGTLSRIDAGGDAARSIAFGAPLHAVAVADGRIWLAAGALQTPGDRER